MVGKNLINIIAKFIGYQKWPARLKQFIRQERKKLYAWMRFFYTVYRVQVGRRVKKIRPVIITHDANIKIVSDFVESYKNASLRVDRPIIAAGYSSEEKKGQLQRLLNKLDPEVVLEQGSYGFSKRGNLLTYFYYDFFRSVLPYIDEFMLYLEDDISFSSKFCEVLRKIKIPQDAGIVTFYSINEGYGPINRYFMYEVQNPCLVGAQALLLPKQIVELCARSGQDMAKLNLAGWEMKFTAFVKNSGYKLYATYYSYVQHQLTSRLHPSNWLHISNRFIP